MANEENLIPIKKGQLTKEEAKKRGRAGGLARTPKKKWAARLRAMKKKGLTDENYKRIVAWMEEPECAVMDVYLAIQSMKSKATTQQELNNCIRAETDLMKFHHHKASSINQTNIQTNDSNKVVINIVAPKDGDKNGSK